MSAKTQIKICGITNFEDVERLIHYPVDYLGFIVTTREISSKVSVEQATEFMSHVPAHIQKVLGVGEFPITQIIEMVRQTGADVVQLQRNGTLAEIAQLRQELPQVKVWKVLHTDALPSFEKIAQFEQAADAILLHTKPAEWKTAVEVARQLKKPFILAGSLDLENINTALKTFHPPIIDLIRGVETVPGKKDFKKVDQLLKVLS